jgi:hypothetical protein
MLTLAEFTDVAAVDLAHKTIREHDPIKKRQLADYYWELKILSAFLRQWELGSVGVPMPPPPRPLAVEPNPVPMLPMQYLLLHDSMLTAILDSLVLDPNPQPSIRRFGNLSALADKGIRLDALNRVREQFAFGLEEVNKEIEWLKKLEAKKAEI